MPPTVANRPTRRSSEWAVVPSYCPASGSKSSSVEPEVDEPLQQPRPAPEHRAGREPELVGVEGHRQPGGQHRGDAHVAAPALRAGHVPGGHDQADRAVLAQQVDDAAHRLGRLEHPVEQLQAPAVAVDAVLALLGMDLGDRVVARQQALPDQAYQRCPVAAAVGHHVDVRAGVAPHDRGDHRLGRALGDRDEQVEGLRHANQAVVDVGPQLGVVHVRHHQHPRRTEWPDGHRRRRRGSRVLGPRRRGGAGARCREGRRSAGVAARPCDAAGCPIRRRAAAEPPGARAPGRCDTGWRWLAAGWSAATRRWRAPGTSATGSRRW